jgi:hypothetical protein
VEQGTATTIDGKLNKSESTERTRRMKIFYRELFKLECRANTRGVPLYGILNRPGNIMLTDNH